MCAPVCMRVCVHACVQCARASRGTTAAQVRRADCSASRLSTFVLSTFGTRNSSAPLTRKSCAQPQCHAGPGRCRGSARAGAVPGQCRGSASAGAVPGQCRGSASAGAVLGQCRGSAGAGPMPGQCRCRASAGPMPGQCRGSAGAVPGQCRGSAGAGPVPGPGQCRAGAGPVPGQCRWCSELRGIRSDRMRLGCVLLHAKARAEVGGVSISARPRRAVSSAADAVVTDLDTADVVEVLDIPAGAHWLNPCYGH
jgi:hypothetical protein